MFELSLLLPERARCQVEDGAIARWLQFGNRAPAAPPGRDACLRECFAFAGSALPVAALTRSLDASDAVGSLWLRADPAYVMADAMTLRLLACGKLNLSADEVDALAQALKPLFGDAGFLLEATLADRWYLRCPRGTRLPTFSPPQDALGDDLNRHLPEGENARRWRGLLNEAQIVLTTHPINAQRVQVGLPPVNSLWFWGAGELPSGARSEAGRVYSDDEVTLALAQLARVADVGTLAQARRSLSTSQGAASQARAQDERVLIDLAAHRDAARLQTDWLAPIDAALKNRSLGALHLCFESGERHLVKPAHRWRFWRRARHAA